MRPIAFAPLVATLLAATLFLAVPACSGDGSDDEGPAASPTATPTATPEPPNPRDLFPDLSAEGLTREPVEVIPGPAGFAIAFAVYSGASGAARAEIRTYPSEVAARTDFKTQVEGWKAPPAGQVFPIDPKNVDSEPVSGPDESHGYVSSRADSSGNQIWTDIYRQGSVIVIAHTLSRDPEAAGKIRRAMADGIMELLP